MLLPDPTEPGPSNLDANEDRLLKSDGEFESSQRSPDRKRRQREGKTIIPNKRPRHDGRSASALEKKIQSSESSIQKLKVHAEKKTCPKDLRYKVRVNIAPDQDFKNDINRIRRDAEQKLIGALTRYHYRRAESNKIKLKKEQQRLNISRGKKTNNPDLIKNRPGKERDNRTDNVISLTAELTNKMKEVEELMRSLKNKESESYPCVFTDSLAKGRDLEKRKIRNNRNHTRRSNRRREKRIYHDKINQKCIKNLSNCEMTTDQINLLSKGLKFIPTPTVKENTVRQQLLLDFKQFARRMRLRYIFHNRDKEQHPFHVKSDWEPPVQPSVALETYLEEVKGQLAEIVLFKPRNNLPFEERKAIKDLRSNSDIVIKKADKGTTTVIMNTKDKIQEGQVLLDDKNNYTPLTTPMVKETARKTRVIIDDLHQGNHIDTMTKKWLLKTPNPPRIPVFYTLTKIHKPTLPGRPIISGCDGPTERISSFLDHILQPIAQAQKSYLKDTTQFINFIEKRTVPKKAILVSMDVSSLYTNIPQEEGINTVCEAYESFYKNDTPIPTHSLAGLLRLILQENSFQFREENYLQTHGTAMGTKVAVSFANIFMSAVETEIINKSKIKPLEWKRYIDDVFSLWDTQREEIDKFILEANRHHPTIKFTAEISDKETNFLDTTIYKGERFHKDSILDISTHFKPTEKFQYTHYTSCHAPGVKKGFIKGEALRLLRTNSSETKFEENICNFKSNLRVRGYPDYLVNKVLAEVKFKNRKSALEQKPQRMQSGLMPFVTQYNPSVPNLKTILMSKWHLIENQPLLREIYREPPFISYRKGKSLKDILVRAKL